MVRPLSLSIFVISFGDRPTINQTPSLTRSARSHRLSNAPPPPTLSFGWLLHRPTEQQPSKTDAPPISQFFDGRHFGAPNKGTKRSARQPGRWASPLGSWGAAAPLFGSMADDAMEREGKADGGRVGRGSSCRVCAVWCEFFFVCVSLIVE